MPILPDLAQELRTHLEDRKAGHPFETRSARAYSPRRVNWGTTTTASSRGWRSWPARRAGTAVGSRLSWLTPEPARLRGFPGGKPSGGREARDYGPRLIVEPPARGVTMQAQWSTGRRAAHTRRRIGASSWRSSAVAPRTRRSSAWPRSAATRSSSRSSRTCTASSSTRYTSATGREARATRSPRAARPARRRRARRSRPRGRGARRTSGRHGRGPPCSRRRSIAPGPGPGARA